MNNELIMMTIQGSDRPGVTRQLTAVLADHNVDILDMGQSVIHDELSLAILFAITDESDSSSILKDLLFKAYEIGMNVKFKPIEHGSYEEWVGQQGKERNIVTLMANRIRAEHIAKVSRIIAEQGLNIDMIQRLSGRRSLEDSNENVMGVVEFSVRGVPKNIEQMKVEFLEASRDSEVDIAFQEDNIYRRNRRLVCFDMDSTLIQTEVIDELARKRGVFDEVAAITESAMRGEIDFKESFVKRVSLLEGLEESVMKDIAENLPLTKGAERLFKTLKKYGYKTAILSGGFTYFGNYLKTKLGIDYVFANNLEVKNGKLTGKHLGDIMDGQKKAEMMKLLAFKEDIDLKQVIAVGDGSNDLPMIQLAGLGIAFHAKPKVKATARNSISLNGLDSILYLLGFRDRELVED